LKPTEWADKATGETKRGLSITVANVLSVYDIKKKRKADTPENSTQQGKPHHRPFNDGIEF
jgi:hypothetical protein